MATTKGRALYSYDAVDSGQLSIKKGQLLDIKGDATPQGWVLVVCKGEEGYVPATYVQEESQPGKPPPKPPGAGGGITMPSTRGSLGNKQPKGSPQPPPGGGRGAGQSSTSVFASRKDSANQLLTGEAAYSIFAYFLEWFGVIAMFLSGLFAFMYGTIIPDPEGAISMGFGAAAMVGASFLALCITAFRDSINCVMASPALSRCALICCCMLGTGGGFPIAALGDGALCFAALGNLLAHYKEGDAAVTSDNWSEYCTDCIQCNTVFRVIFTFLFLAADGGIFYFGYTNGFAFALGQSTGDRNFLDPVSWGITEGFGTVISFNIALLFIFALYGFQEFINDRAKQNSNFCTDLCSSFLDSSAQLFIHVLFSISLTVAVFCHMAANFAAFENSGAYRSYLTIFGFIPLVTGMIAFGMLSILLAGSHANIKTNLKTLFRGTHLIAVFLAILLIFHGANGLGRNFWKWMAGPLAIYLVDVLFRAGWVSGGDN